MDSSANRDELDKQVANNKRKSFFSFIVNHGYSISEKTKNPQGFFIIISLGDSDTPHRHYYRPGDLCRVILRPHYQRIFELLAEF